MSTDDLQNPFHMNNSWLKPLEAVAALLLVIIFTLLLGGVISRYVFAYPIIWIDEVVSLSFLWFAMIGTAIAMHRNEHLRLTLFQDMLPPRLKGFVQAFGLVAISAFLLGMLPHAIEYVKDEMFIRTPAMDIPNGYRVAAIAFGMLSMLTIVLVYAVKSTKYIDIAISVLIVGGVTAACAHFSPQLQQLGSINLFLFLVVFGVICLLAGVPIAFCFGIGALSYLAFSTQTPLMVIVGRMDEGMSSLILISVPIFVLLGCILDITGMGKAIVDFLASLLGHVRAGMSYVLLGSLFIVSGISGSKVSDMATVAPALFPEMKRRGHKPKEMIALLATGAAMADTVPPSIVMIVLGSVAGVSIAGLFQSGFVIAMVLLFMLVALARWKARLEDMSNVKKANMKVIGKFLLVASPALVLPFIIRSAVGGGVATATEVSTIAVLYAMIIGKVLYGGISLKQKHHDKLTRGLDDFHGGHHGRLLVVRLFARRLACHFAVGAHHVPDSQKTGHSRHSLLHGSYGRHEHWFDDAAHRGRLLLGLSNRWRIARSSHGRHLALHLGFDFRSHRDCLCTMAFHCGFGLILERKNSYGHPKNG